MSKNSKINWVHIVSIAEFKSGLNLILLKELSMVSKLIREKLKPILFKNLKLSLYAIKFDSNVISIAHDNKYCLDYDYKDLKKRNNGSVEGSVNDFINSLIDIKKYTNGIALVYNFMAGYYLFTITKLFDNLTDLKIDSCDFSLKEFIDIGKTHPNLNRLEMVDVNLVKSTTDTISTIDIVFPPNLTYLKVSGIYLTTTTLLSHPYEYLFNTKGYLTYEYFTLPNISIPTLKHLVYCPMNREDSGIEAFLEANPNVESLLTYRYCLNITSSLKSLKSLDNDDLMLFNDIDQAFRLRSINNLTFSTKNFNFSENIRRLCQLCPNLVNLNIRFIGNKPDFQPIIDTYLLPTLSNLHSLKTLVLIDRGNNIREQILDFTKFSQIEKLKLTIWGSLLNIKFDKCKSLKQIEFKSQQDKFTDELQTKFNDYKNWKFKFSEYGVKGYKI